MNKHYLLNQLLLSLLSFPLIANQLFAQDTEQGLTSEEDKQWYQVELVIFANNNPEAAHEEQWPEELGLSYPTQLTHLRETVRAVDNASPNNTPPNELLTVNDEVITTDNSKIAEQLIETTDSKQVSLRDAEISATTQPLIAFSQLDNEQLTLIDAANKITQQYSFRPLFHKAWRQHIDGRKTATSILITGGETYDDHFELEGSVKISVERYLHIDTDLWLNQFVSKTGQALPSWPTLPPIPTLIDESDATDLKIATVNQTNSAAYGADLDTKDTVEELSSERVTSSTASEGAEGLEFTPVVDPLSSANKNLEQQLRLLSDAQYTIERTVAMRQHRRMRSKELHYIDHPLFGVLIRIIPYEKPTDEDRAGADQG
jgi:hypothetical protein